MPYSTFSERSAHTRRWTVCIASALILALSGCGLIVGDGPNVADVANASEASPRTFTGPDTALLESSDIVPITTDPQPTLPVEFTGLDDVSVTIDDTSRILALDGTGSIASIVFGLGFGPNVVGRDLTTGFESAKDLPLVMNNHTLNAESILALNPTLVLTDYSVGPYDVQMQIRNAGIPVVFFDPAEDFDSIPRLIGDVATSLGVPELGDDYIADYERRLADTLARIDAVVPVADEDKVRMVFLYMRGRAGVYHLFGNNPDGTTGAAGVIIETLGGIDAAGENDWESGALTAEGLLKLEPDLYLMLTLGLESVGGVEGLMTVPGVDLTPAGERQRVVDMSDYEMFTWGPRTPEVLTALAESVYRVKLDEVELP
ncbi:Heme ABC transporter, cell surface heme and hemoprotein receptor HmuT [Leucobacter sp. 7(1)]|uniref:heme/hemin ABC transporter substrate-binding protein n=1 Tax=Leucobacter sp. 7(1) TaxID=1255613 RepID=UPI00097F6721|nr:ABC transporter substrate-binding protein [Leucobacter sp. 7(1)]SJN09511.1 Heme ABC transporter, cell surface heme and hemoprotein receptor HmuT [Leucobacter sp. 7(1)]